MKLEITFISDWHPGMGAGRPGDLDRLVRRDVEGLPCLSARTLVGMWRDAAEALAQALESNGQGGWLALINDLFGTQPALGGQGGRAPQPSLLRVDAPRLSGRLARVLAEVPILREGLTFAVPSVAIDSSTGAAAENKLFFTEMVRKGAVLSANAHLDLPRKYVRTAELFLAAAAEGIRAMGGKRRRGKGLCRVRVDDLECVDDLQSATDAFFDALPNLELPNIPGKRASSGASPASGLASGRPAWHGWRLGIRCLEPLCAWRRTTGNVEESYDHVPGTLLLGAVASRLEAAGHDVFSLLADGHLLMRSAMPSVSGRRGCPVPLAFFEDKFSNRLAQNLLEELPDGNASQWKQLRKGYVEPEPGDALRVVDVTVVQQVHNVIHDDLQRPDESLGGIYTRQAIPQGTQLQAEILLFGPPGAAESVEGILDGLGELRLGRATKADYGRVSLSREDWKPPVPEVRKDSRLVLWLVSPLLFRGPSLLPSIDPVHLEKELAQVLGVSVEFRPNRSIWRVIRRESWQRSWSLARPSLVGLAAGSVLTFHLQRDPQGSALTELAIRGIGERRGEGMGEIIVNPEWVDASPSHRSSSQQLGSPGRTPTAEDIEILQSSGLGRAVLMGVAMRAVERAVVCSKMHESFEKDGSASQIGALRSLVASAPVGQVAAKAKEWAIRKPRAKGKTFPHEAAQKEVQTLLAQKSFWACLAASSASSPWLMSETADEDTAMKRLRSEIYDEALRILLVDWCQRRQRGVEV